VTGVDWLLGGLAAFALGAVIIAAGLTMGRSGVIAEMLGAHIARCFRQMGRDLVRAIGGTVVAVALSPVALYRLARGRRRGAREAIVAAGHELREAFHALVSLIIVQPLRLIGLHGVVGHVRTRIPAALGDPAEARNGSAEFEGYTVIRELKAGGSGARIFVCEPDARTRIRIGLKDGFVVIKSFDFDDGTNLAEMLRESRSLEGARRLGLVLDHESTERRFHYVMRFQEGLELGKFVRRMHELAGADGLDREQFVLVASLVRDIVATLQEWHEAGLWHKDVKPENAIVHEGRATLIDLSLVTPLASQMTLTTHGTEYFRDPEMVRQALRGARVSDVDAARFDIYGAGAVLHFVLEGTFPAHGVLSGFRKPSPECLRWISRRAMADFDHRYASAEEMLRDLDRAILGGDPAAVRPADLPSMHGSSAEPTPDAAKAPPLPPDARRRQRPRVRMTNWWSGSYALESARPLPEAIPLQARGGIGPPLAVLVAALGALGAIIAIWLWLGAA
jgi:serine/threonine protein kinase